jgi:hypothetical protein
MKNRSLWLVSAVATLLAVTVSLAAAPSTDISWIGRLPGVSNAVQSEDGDSIKVVYSLSGDPEKTLDRLYAGLEDRGWTVHRSGLAALGGMSLQAVRANKGRATLHIALADQGAARAIIVHLEGGTTDPPATIPDAAVTAQGRSGRGTAVVREPGNGSVSVDAKGRVVIQDENSGDTVTAEGGRVVARDGSGQTAVIEPGRVTAKDGSGRTVVVEPGRVVAKDSGGQTVVVEPGRVVAKDSGGRTAVVGGGSASVAGRNITINDDNVVRRIQCDGGTDIVLNGDDCKLTLEGDCHALSIQGDANRAEVLGAIESISVLGDNNLVTWSADANPTRPRVQNVGDDNVVRSSSR